MPYLKIQTNQSVDTDRQQELLSDLSRLTASELGKPESYVMVAMESDMPMLFAGDNAPLVYMELKSIGLDESMTGKLSNALCNSIQQHIGVNPDRIYIEFASAPRKMWGWNNSTF